jgi:CBS domain-containing protein
MRRDFISCTPEESLHEVERTMRLARIRHVPVLEAGELVGVLSHRDLLQAALERLERLDASRARAYLDRSKAGQLMTADPITTSPDATLAEAAGLMLRHGIGCLPVVERLENRTLAIGIVTESDLLRAAYSGTTASEGAPIGR